MTTEQQLKEYISSNLLFSENGYPYPDDASFLEEGIVDSVGIMELVAFIEENMNVSVEDQEITPDNFDSITKLAAYIQRKSA
jgi:acyl carrier protein